MVYVKYDSDSCFSEVTQDDHFKTRSAYNVKLN
jgi:hypothetical protein